LKSFPHRFVHSSIRTSLLTLAAGVSFAAPGFSQEPQGSPEPSPTVPQQTAMLDIASPKSPGSVEAPPREAGAAPPAAGRGAAPSTEAAADTSVIVARKKRPDERKGLNVGLRLAYGMPGGSISEHAKLSDSSAGIARLQGDLSWQFVPSLSLGLYLGFGGAGGTFDRSCSEGGSSCSVYDANAGIAAEYRFLPDAVADPWLGVGIGAEGLHRSAKNGSYDSTLSSYGAEMNVSAGADVQLSDMTLGPYAQFQIGRYASSTYEVNAQEIGASDYDGSAFHQWIFIGLRGKFLLSK
jgi:hypothetical protein